MTNYTATNIGRFSALFNALSNPHRLQIYNLLSGCCPPESRSAIGATGSCCVGDIGELLDIAASTLSHHLKELNHAGLIDMQRDGKQIICSINTDTLDEIREYFRAQPEVDNEPETG